MQTEQLKPLLSCHRFCNWHAIQLATGVKMSFQLKENTSDGVASHTGLFGNELARAPLAPYVSTMSRT